MPMLKNPVKPKSGKNNDREESEFQLLGKLENMAISKIPPPRAKDKIRPVLSFCLSSGFFSLVLFEGGAGSFSLDFNWRMAD